MHNFIKRSLALLLTLAIMFGVLPLCAAAEEAAPTYTGDKLVAVNTNFSTSGKIAGSFTAQSDLAALASMMSLDSSSGEGVYKIYRDPDTGKRMTIVEPDLPELIPAEDDGCMTASEMLPEPVLSEHTLDDTFRLTSKDKSKMDMVCLYVGTYCTVWGTTSDDAAIQLNAEQAQAVGEHFDDFFPEVTNAFGSYWYDADGDGRVAVMCYDIDRNYGSSVDEYTAGYFYSVDMLGFDGRINGIKFNGQPTNAMDCIHIDTYPLMGYSRPMQSVEDCYETLVHEFQHMLNFSSCVENDSKPWMPSYLNEAFSMAAEHMICGASATSNRISYFNGSSYVPGTALTYWGSTLSNYSNSYLFGQYIRTRYGALNGDDGSTIFKTILQMHQTDPNTDFLRLIANLLETTEQALITDFWCACYLKEETGVWGFQGERWADAISPRIAADFSSTSAIYNGGAKYYDLTNGFTPASASNVTFIALDDPEVEIPTDAPVLMDLTAERLSLTEATITFTPDQAGTLFYALTNRVITDKSEVTYELGIEAAAFTTLWIDTLTEPDQAPTFYYFTEANGVQSELQSITIPPVDFHFALTQPNEAELFIHTPQSGTAYIALYDTQTGRMLELVDYALSGTDFWQYICTEHDMTACTVKVFVVDENGAPTRAAFTA